MAFDKNPLANEADKFVAGKTTEQVVRAIHAGAAPDGAMAALIGRFDRKAEKRASEPVAA